MLSNSLQCSSQQNCEEKVFPKSCAGYPLRNALPNRTAMRKSSQRAAPGILLAMLFPTELQREGLPKARRVSSLQCFSLQNCKEKVFPKSCAGHPLCNAFPYRTAMRKSSQRAVPGILFAMLFPTELQREGLPKELCRVSSLQCSSPQNCNEKVFPKSCAGYPLCNALPNRTAKRKSSQSCAGDPLCNALPNRTAKRRSSQRAAPGILFAMLFPTELQREGLLKELRRVSSSQCSSQQNCKEKVFPKSCAGYPLRNALPNRTAKRRSSQSCAGHPLCNAFPYRTAMRKSSQSSPGILFAMLFPTELQREGLPKELCRASSLQCFSLQNWNEKVLPKSCVGYPLCNALPHRTAKRRSSQRAAPGILFAMLFPTELQWESLPKAVPGILFAMLFPTELQREGLLKELCRVSSSQCSSQQNCKEKVFPKSCAGYPLCNALPHRTAKRRSSQRAAPGILFAMLFPTELQWESLPKELRRVSSLQCSSQQNCNEKVFPKLCRVSSLQCSSQQNCKEKVFSKSCAGYPLCNALPNRTAKRRSSQRAAPGILFAMLFPTELQREGLPKELRRVSSSQCSSQQNCKEKVFPKSGAGHPLCNAFPYRTAMRKSSQRAVPGILFAMLFPTELQREGLPKELCRASSLQCFSLQNCNEKVFPKSCAGYPLCNALPNRTAKRRSSHRSMSLSRAAAAQPLLSLFCPWCKTICMCVLPALLNHLPRVICTRRQVAHLEVSIGYRLGIDRVSLEPRLFCQDLELTEQQHHHTFKQSTSEAWNLVAIQYCPLAFWFCHATSAHCASHNHSHNSPRPKPISR